LDIPRTVPVRARAGRMNFEKAIASYVSAVKLETRLVMMA
jgi:hypothetical protein